MRNNRRGFTLAELSIVLAVLAIVSTMVVSFTIMANKNTQVSTARLEALQDIRVAEAIIEDFIEENEITTEFVENDKGEPIVENSLSAKDKTLSFTLEEGKTIGGTLEITGENANADKITLDRVTSITFAYYGKTTENIDNIIYCTINYKIGNEKYQYTFCVLSVMGVETKEVTDK